ncbi:MAG: winged helix-turn-helix transcriptional regulator [Ruminococcaceae bacterium]|nr:winged helix-turn-helix transcriptional regulator [Oscillospiraceae bacterium]
MNAKQIVKAIMEEQGVTNATLASRLGISQAALWDRLNNKKNKDLSVAILCDMLQALDYDVVITPRGKGTKADGAYKVSKED